MQTWGEPKHATSWLRPFFFSILSFIFHLPEFLVQPPENFSNENHKEAYGPITKKIYLSYETIHTWHARAPRALNIVASGLYYASLENVAPAKTEAQSTSVYVSQAAYALGGAEAAFILLYISTGLWIVTFAYMRVHYARLSMHHPTSPALKVPRKFYYLVCIDPINFSLDLPGLGHSVVLYTCIAVRLLNIVYGSIYLFAYFCEMPMVECWGCYQRGTSIKDLDDGLCASCPLLSAQDVLPSVCDHAEAECGRGALLWQDMLAHDIWIANTVLNISLCIYIFYNSPRRLDEYERLRVQAA